MPNRVLRAGLFQSEAFLFINNDCRICFIACILSADDLGNFEAGYGDLYRLWRDLDMGSKEQVELIRQMLSTVDLVRWYEIGGKRYGHIPRFRQRLRFYKRVNPRPPPEIEDNEIKELVSKWSDHSQTKDGTQSDSRRREVEVEVEVEVETKRKKATVGNSQKIPPAQAVDNSHGKGAEGKTERPKVNGHELGQRWSDPAWVAATAKLLDMRQEPMEDQNAFRDRVYGRLQSQIAVAKASLRKGDAQ
jgi:hypothetical protein